MSHVSQRLRRRFTRFGGGKAKDGSAADALLLATVPRLGFSSARRLVRTSLLCPWIFTCFLQLKALVQTPSRLHLKFVSILEFQLLFRSRLPTSISHDSLDASTKGPPPSSPALKACGFIFTYTPIPLPPSSHRHQFLALTSVHLRVLRLFSLDSFVSLRLDFLDLGANLRMDHFSCIMNRSSEYVYLNTSSLGSVYVGTLATSTSDYFFSAGFIASSSVPSVYSATLSSSFVFVSTPNVLQVLPLFVVSYSSF